MSREYSKRRIAIEHLTKYCLQLVEFTPTEISLIENYFFESSFKKKSFILKHGEVCDFIGFLNKGCIRHFHIKDGNEITCDISFENSFITEFNSFNTGSKSQISFQALEDSQLLLIPKSKLLELYKMNPKFEELGRKVAEKTAIRNTNIAMSLASDNPEKRYSNLLKETPEIFQRVQQKYIANILGIKPESLSRIQKRVFSKLKS